MAAFPRSYLSAGRQLRSISARKTEITNALRRLVTPDWWRTSLFGKPNQTVQTADRQMESKQSTDSNMFHSCFISYSSADQDFVQYLYARLLEAGVKVWFAPEDIQGGKLMIDQVERAIRNYDKLLIVLSEASLESNWVKTELFNAREAEYKTGKRKLFPVRLVDFDTLRAWKCFDCDGGKDLAREVREYFIPDFSHWKEHDQFEASFARLLNDLKAETRVGG
jgi:hypothetical protein